MIFRVYQRLLATFEGLLEKFVCGPLCVSRMLMQHAKWMSSCHRERAVSLKGRRLSRSALTDTALHIKGFIVVAAENFLRISRVCRPCYAHTGHLCPNLSIYRYLVFRKAYFATTKPNFDIRSKTLAFTITKHLLHT